MRWKEFYRRGNVTPGKNGCASSGFQVASPILPYWQAAVQVPLDGPAKATQRKAVDDTAEPGIRLWCQTDVP